MAVPLRRLTRAQYNHTVFDLLGISGNPADDFGADEPSGGFAANATAPVEALQVEHYQRVAEELAARAVEDLSALAPCAPPAQPEAECLGRFLRDFGTRAYRRPLSADEIGRYEQLFTVGKAPDGTFADGLRLVIETMLQSPHFLYRLELGNDARSDAHGVPLTGYEVASRLSYFLNDSMPDAELLLAAGAEELSNEAQLKAQAERLLSKNMARQMYHSFHEQWMEMEDLPSLEKNDEVYPSFTPALRSAMADELSGFLDYVMGEGAGSLDLLLTSNVSFVRGPLFEVYGLAEPQGSDGNTPQRVTLPESERAGLFTLASVMARHSHPDQSSPVKRGYMVLDKLLCTVPPPPPAGVDITTPEVDPNVSTRERFEQHRSDPACASCHALMDPLGFPFEIYDGIGRHRSSDGGARVDASSMLTGTDSDGPVQDAVELMNKLASATNVQRCVGKQWFRYAFGRLEDERSPGDRFALDTAFEAFRNAEYRLPALLAAMTTTRAFRYRKPIDGP